MAADMAQVFDKLVYMIDYYEGHMRMALNLYNLTIIVCDGIHNIPKESYEMLIINYNTASYYHSLYRYKLAKLAITEKTAAIPIPVPLKTPISAPPLQQLPPLPPPLSHPPREHYNVVNTSNLINSKYN